MILASNLLRHLQDICLCCHNSTLKDGKKLVAGIHGIMGLAVIFREDALDLGSKVNMAIMGTRFCKH